MKQLILGILVALAISACQQELDTYSGTDFAYFDNTGDSTFFSYAYEDSRIVSDSIWVYVKTSGMVADHDRQVKVRVAETNGEAGVDFAPVAESITISAGRAFAAGWVELLRPEILKKEERFLVLELEENEDFRLMMPSVAVSSNSDKRYSKIRYKIVFSEIMSTPPKGWSETFFGAFSVKKLDKICRELNMSRDSFNDASYINPRREYIATKMKKILDTNPEFEDDGVTMMRMGDMYYN